MTHELNLEYVTLNLATSGAYECMAKSDIQWSIYIVRRLQLSKALAQLSVTCDARTCVSVNSSVTNYCYCTTGIPTSYKLVVIYF